MDQLLEDGQELVEAINGDLKKINIIFQSLEAKIGCFLVAVLTIIERS